MTRRDSDELLWQLSRVGGSDSDKKGDGDRLSWEVLVAWRAGCLGEAEAARLEGALAHDSATRQRLYRMARGENPSPPPALRSRVLAAVARSARPTGPSARPAGPSRVPLPRGWVLQVAALAAASVLILGWYLLVGGGGLESPADLPGELEFNVGLEMLAEVRSGAPSRGSGAAYAGTMVRIVIEPREEARAGLEFGLYRGRSGSTRSTERLWERLSTGSGVRLDTGRGTAVFEALAGELVGPEPGSRDLLVAVASAGRLPATLELVAGEEAVATLAARSGGRAYRHTITVLADPGLTGPVPTDPAAVDVAPAVPDST